MKLLFFLFLFSLALSSEAQSGPAEDILRDWANISIFHLDQSNQRITAIENLKGKRRVKERIGDSMRSYLFSDFRLKAPEDYAVLLLLDGDFEPHEAGMKHQKKVVWMRSKKSINIRGYGEVDLKVLRKIAAEQRKAEQDADPNRDGAPSD